METPTALDLRVERSLQLLRRHLGPRGRVLDVGCGEGRFVELLTAGGYDASGIDSSDEAVETARAAGRKAELRGFLDERSGPYDALFFGGSLHHLAPLADAVAHAAELLGEGGLLLADEFDLDAPDRPTAAWFFDLMDLLDVVEPVEACEHADPAAADVSAEPLERWRARHVHDPPLATAAEMIEALGARFEILAREPCAYLYWYALRRLDPTADGREIGERLIGLEERLIESGRIRPVGLRIAARRKGS